MSGSFCVPRAGAQDAIPLPPNGSCPFGWTQQRQLLPAQRQRALIFTVCVLGARGTIRRDRRQQKTGATLAIPVHSELQAIIAAAPIGHLTLLTTKTGKSYGRSDFSDQFRAWCEAAGLPQRCTFHGLRKAALTRLANAGCTVHEIALVQDLLGGRSCHTGDSR